MCSFRFFGISEQMVDSQKAYPSALSSYKKIKLTYKNPNKLSEESIMDTTNLLFSDDDFLTYESFLYIFSVIPKLLYKKE